eukprot:scaffold165116_cov26-Tisochrysis_lutea.AAC.2
METGCSPGTRRAHGHREVAGACMTSLGHRGVVRHSIGGRHQHEGAARAKMLCETRGKKRTVKLKFPCGRRLVRCAVVLVGR